MTRNDRLQLVWLLLLVIITAGQVGLAFKLFSAEGTIEAVFDERPIVSGRHPLHFVQGELGAEIFRARSATTCFDPTFQAGYPKTPLFDAGCRPVEVFLLLGLTGHPISDYKLGIILTCLIVPLVLAASARGMGLSPAAATLTAGLGVLLFWSEPMQQLLAAGELQLILAGLLLFLFLGGLIRYSAEPGIIGWLLLSTSAFLGWSIHPLACIGVLPLFGVYYLITAPSHGLAWHLGLVGVILVGLVPNLWWLGDWVKFSWVRQATAEPLPPIPSWNHILGSFHDYQRHLGEAEISWPLMILAGLGLLAMLRGPFLRVVLYSCLVLMVLGTSRLGECWPLAKNMGLEHAGLLIPAMALIPAVDLVSKVLTGARVLPIISLCVALLPALCAWTDLAGSLSLRITPLRQGLTDGQQKLITDLQNKTQPDARILLEQTDHRGSSWNWTAYLPRLTQRAYLGGLDPDAAIEHMSCQWYRGLLAQRPLALWTDEERDDYIEKYNISWVLCRTREGVAFWNRYPGATILSTYDDGQPATLIALPRSPSFVLSGTATLERAESTRIVLTNVAPDEDGEVILSLHYQPELRAAPLVVQIEKAQDITDPVPFIKLKVPGPVSRVTLTWEHP